MFKFTKNQEALLNVFFAQANNAFYLRELGRKLGKEPGVFQRDINKLVQSGFLASEFKGNSRFFALNKKHPLYVELKNIYLKTNGVAGTLKRALADIPGIKRAFIYGSFARGEERADSDIDLMVIGSVEEDKLLDKISELESLFGRPINYGLIGDGEFKKKVKSGNSFLKNILKQKVIELI